MRTRARVLVLGSVLTLAISALVTASGSAADDDEAKLRKEFDKLAELAGKDPAAMKKETMKFAKEQALDEIMNLMRKRISKGGKVTGGLGVGKTPTNAPDDGMEARIQNLSRGKPIAADKLAKDAEALEQMAYRTAVIGVVAIAHTPPKKVGEKDPKEWKEFSDEMVDQSLALAKAVKAKNPKAVQDSAKKLNASCTSCHAKFRD